jgi:hypothetical protein
MNFPKDLTWLLVIPVAILLVVIVLGFVVAHCLR